METLTEIGVGGEENRHGIHNCSRRQRRRW